LTGGLSCGWQGDEARLLEEFHRVVRVFQKMDPGMREVIKDITRRMGAGMAEFVSKDLGQGTTTIDEYNRYCHFVAGLVGEGLTRLFAEGDFEDKEVGASARARG
jgi:farnesyl-diphosphate farnesyltransferase